MRTLWREGNIVRIDLGDGIHSYGQLCRKPLIAFFSGAFAEDIPFEQVPEIPVLFRLWVYTYAVTKRIWPVIGHRPLSEFLTEEPFFRKQDRMNGRLSLYHSSFSTTNWERPASLAECEGLECAAVWDPEHVADRIRDHLAGRPNKWVESLRIRPLPDS
jgi:Immunity protein 26